MSGFSYGSNEGWSRMLRPKMACIASSIGMQPVNASVSPTTKTPRRSGGRLAKRGSRSRDMGALPVLGDERGLVLLQDPARVVELPAFGGDVDAEAAGHEL